jgi:type IV pilus assembly protein PilM
LLGLDLDSSSVRLVELGRDAQGRLALERCAAEPLAPGWVADGRVEQFEAVAAAVRRAVRESRTRTRDVALALPPSAVITRRIALPGGLSEQALEIQVESEAGQYIPFPLDAVSLDFRVIGPGAGPAGEVEVLIAASPRDKVRDRQDLAEASGLRAVILDVESHASRLAAARWIERLPRQGRDAVVALFEVDACAIGMQVLRNQEALYERDQVFGGDASEPAAPDVAREIARALRFFFTSTSHRHVDHVLLAGVRASLPGLADAVTRQTSLACSLANPFDGMEIGGGVRSGKVMPEAPAYLTACGLAMRRFAQ